MGATFSPLDLGVPPQPGPKCPSAMPTPPVTCLPQSPGGAEVPESLPDSHPLGHKPIPERLGDMAPSEGCSKLPGAALCSL